MRHGPFGLAIAGAALAALLVAPAAPSVAAAGPSCEFTGVDRIVAVGDVHGAYDRFVEILQTTGLLDSRLRWSGGKTHLVQLGDVVDRGPDSRKALDLLRRLQDDARRAGGAVHVLLGNHEAMRMLGDMRYTLPEEYKAFVTDRSDEIRKAALALVPPEQRDQLLKDTPLGYIELRLAFGRKGIYGDWLRTLDVALKINGVLFVHGGIGPATADLSCDDINRAARRELTEDEEKTRLDPLHTLVAGRGRSLVVSRTRPGTRHLRPAGGRDREEAAGPRDRCRPLGHAGRADPLQVWRNRGADRHRYAAGLRRTRPRVGARDPEGHVHGDLYRPPRRPLALLLPRSSPRSAPR